MMRWLAQTRDRISAKGHGFLSFAKNMGKNNGKYRSKLLTELRISQKLYHRIVQRQLKLSMVKKYLVKKDICISIRKTENY